MNRGRNVQGRGWRQSGTKSISWWLRYTHARAVSAETVNLGLGLLIDDVEAMNLSTPGVPFTSKIEARPLQWSSG